MAEKKSKSENLRKAKTAKNDEFYTQINDISDELCHYKAHFKDKTVFCNCDDPVHSAFWKYFHLNFKHLGLKKLITTHYDRKEKTYKMEYSGGDDNDINVGTKTPLEGNGDFRNAECIALLEQSDIVVTNPPFSLFREYVAQLVKYKKKFLILGNNNAITYKEIFPLIKNNDLWLGYSSNKTIEFGVPDHYEIKKGAGEVREGKKYIRVPAISWFTNLDHTHRHDKLILIRHYNPEEYPKYDNYDAINVDKTLDIPADYDGVMGVPISFLDKYNSEQFEILGMDDHDYAIKECPFFLKKSDDEKKRLKKLNSDYREHHPYFLASNKLRTVYHRIFIKSKTPTPQEGDNQK